MPRILGQKKLRASEKEEDSIAMYNAVTALDLFARHENLADFLLTQLTSCQSSKRANEPSLVPILAMLSRVSPGWQDNKLSEFKMLFVHYLGHREYLVRRLAAKSLVSFSNKHSLIGTFQMLSRLCLDNLASNNFVHGCLQAMTYCLRLMKNEMPQDYERDQPQIRELLMRIKELCPFNQLILLDMQRSIGQEVRLVEKLDFCHPGARDLRIKYHAQEELTSLDDCKRFLTKGHSIADLVSFIECNALDKSVLTGPMIEEATSRIVQESSQLDSEAALEMLQVLTHSKLLVEQEFGTCAASACVAASGLALNYMTSQEDFKMFFGDCSSPYVATFCQLADLAVDMAKPESQEVHRLYAGDFLLHITDIFKLRIFGQKETCELSIHMRYGLVQALNAALVLLNDEHGPARRKIVTWVTSLGQKCESASAAETLVRLGLDHFEDCAEFFLPIAQLSNVDWTLVKAKSSWQLFQSGDGINVYEEPAFSAQIYARVLLAWLQENQRPKFRLHNCGHILDKALQFSQDLLNGLGEFAFGSPLAQPKIYTNASKIFYLLQIVAKFPHSVLEPPSLSEAECKYLLDIGQNLHKYL